jgi:MFS family permease
VGQNTCLPSGLAWARNFRRGAHVSAPGNRGCTRGRAWCAQLPRWLALILACALLSFSLGQRARAQTTTLIYNGGMPVFNNCSASNAASATAALNQIRICTGNQICPSEDPIWSVASDAGVSGGSWSWTLFTTYYPPCGGGGLDGPWVGIVLVTACMGIGHSFALWILWRFAAGVLSAGAMIATSAWVLPVLAKARRPALAGFVYAGVGIGIAVVGTLCLIMARLGTNAQQTWYGLSILGIAVALALSALIASSRSDESFSSPLAKQGKPGKSFVVILCYGIGGFGYILPATFLPAMARTFVDDPSKFGALHVNLDKKPELRRETFTA